MLCHLHVKNFALIEECEIDFSEGLNILTGETGAGKSIIIGSIFLALGGRVTADVIRKNCDFASVELVFEIKEEPLISQLKEFGIMLEEGQLILSRKIMENRTLNRINGENVTVSMLKKISELLLDIHGQHEHQSLLHKKHHLGVVDAYASVNLETEKEMMGSMYRRYKEILELLEHQEMSEEEKKRTIDFLQYEIDEIAEANLKIGEDTLLEDEYRRMNNYGKITEKLGQAKEAVENYDGGAISLIGQAAKNIMSLQGTDEKIDAMGEQASMIEGLLADLLRDMEHYLDSSVFDGQALQEMEERLNKINRLKSKYGAFLEDILAYQENAQKKLDGILNQEEVISNLKAEKEELLQKMEKNAEGITQIRKKAAKGLEKEIIAALKDLNFMDVRFEIHFEKLSRLTPEGNDEVQFLISMNPGEAMKPLDKVASGGELSRIMLALKSVFAKKDAIGTLIFDEIDTGVSGRTAQKVSEKMALIAKERQIICITHLPQIAAMAQTHFLIQKSAQNQKVVTTIEKLSEEESVEELARILGGAKITEAVYASAREMKQMATVIRES